MKLFNDMKTKRCHVCQKNFEATHGKIKYCSPDCVRKIRNIEQNERRRKEPAEKNCSKCGAKFLPTRASQCRCEKCRQLRRKRVDRPHVISVNMKPNTMSVSSMGHLAKHDEPTTDDLLKLSPDLSKVFRVEVDKRTLKFPSKQERFDFLMSQKTNK